MNDPCYSSYHIVGLYMHSPFPSTPASYILQRIFTLHVPIRKPLSAGRYHNELQLASIEVIAFLQRIFTSKLRTFQKPHLVWFPECPLFGGKNTLQKCFGTKDSVRCSEFRGGMGFSIRD